MTVDWFALFEHFASLSMLAIGGAITTTPEMHRFLVDQRAWLTDSQFASSVALAQAAPGPNILFVALIGWSVGLNAEPASSHGGIPWLPLAGMAISMVGIMLPSSLLAYTASRWVNRNRSRLGVRAFKAGMAPLVVALLLATTGLLASAYVEAPRDWPLGVLTCVSALVVWRTRVHLLWLLLAGAGIGAAWLR